MCCFSAKSDRCTGTARRSDGPRRYKLASMKFNTFGETVFLRLPRSCRVAEKSDPIARFSAPDCRKSWKIDGFHRISQHSVLPSTCKFNSSHGGGGSAPPTHPPRLNSYFYYFVLGSREPKNTVFQQNPIVAQAQLDAPMDSDAVIAAA